MSQDATMEEMRDTRQGQTMKQSNVNVMFLYKLLVLLYCIWDNILASLDFKIKKQKCWLFLRCFTHSVPRLINITIVLGFDRILFFFYYAWLWLYHQ